MSSLYTGFCNYSTVLPSRPLILLLGINNFFKKYQIILRSCSAIYLLKNGHLVNVIIYKCTHYRKPAALLYQQNNMVTARFYIRKQQDLSVLDSICNIKNNLWNMKPVLVESSKSKIDTQVIQKLIHGEN